MTKAHIQTENSENKGQYTNATKNFDYTTVADRLRTFSWSNNSNPTGVVKPVSNKTRNQTTTTYIICSLVQEEKTGGICLSTNENTFKHTARVDYK